MYSNLNNPNLVTVFISADRGDVSPETNKKNRDLLEAALRRYGLGYVKITGGYVEKNGTEVIDEKSYVVFTPKVKEDNLVFLTINLAKQTNQDAIMFIRDGRAYYIECDVIRVSDLKSYKSLVQDLLEDKKYVSPLGKFSTTKINQFFSVIKGRKFAFSTAVTEEVPIKEYERTWSRALRYNLNKNLEDREIEQDMINLFGERSEE